MRAVVDLAVHSGPTRLSRTAEVARRTGTPLKFLEAIVSELRRAGIVEARRGAEGGVRLARSVDRITAGQVWRAVDGPLVSPSVERGNGADGNALAVQWLWTQVDRVVEREVDGVTLDELVKRAQQTSSTLDFSI